MYIISMNINIMTTVAEEHVQAKTSLPSANNSSTYIDTLKYVNEERNKAKTEFKTCLDTFYEQLNTKFNKVSEMKKLSDNWKDLDTKLVISWYCKTFRSEGYKLLSMANDSKILDTFCFDKKYVLPGVRTLQLLTKKELEDNKNERALLLKQLIRKHLPLLYVYSEIIETGNKETSINTLLVLVNTKNRIISTIKNSNEVSNSTDSKVPLTIEDTLKMYSQLNMSMPDLDAPTHNPTANKSPKLNMGLMASFFLSKLNIGGKFEEQIKEKIKIGLESGAFHKMAEMIIVYYMEKDMINTATIVQDAFNLILSTMANSIGPKDKILVKLLGLFDKIMQLIGPEIESKRINPKDIFVTILDKIKNDPSGKGKELIGPLEALCAMIDNTTEKKEIDKKQAMEVLTNIFCAVNKCDKDKAQSTFEPILGILDKIKKPDGSLDLQNVLSAVNEAGGIDKIKDIFTKMTSDNKTSNETTNIEDSTTDNKIQNKEVKQLTENTTTETANDQQIDMSEIMSLAESIGILSNNSVSSDSGYDNSFLDSNLINQVFNDPTIQNIMKSNTK
jgi:hypothetical protein